MTSSPRRWCLHLRVFRALNRVDFLFRLLMENKKFRETAFYNSMFWNKLWPWCFFLIGFRISKLILQGCTLRKSDSPTCYQVKSGQTRQRVCLFWCCFIVSGARRCFFRGRRWKVSLAVSNLSSYSDLKRLKHAMILQCIIGFHVAPCPKTPAWQQHVQQLTSKFSSAIETTGAVGTFCSKDFRNSLHSALFWGMWMCKSTCAMQGHVRTISDIDVEQGKMMDHQASYRPREKKMLRIGDR